MKLSRNRKKYSKLYKKNKKSKKSRRSKNRKDSGNIFGRKKEIPEKSNGKPGNRSKIIYIDSPKRERIQLSKSQYKLIQDWSRKELGKKKK